MMSKRFFWLKLNEGFFDEKYIKALRRLPQGDSLVVVYLKMQLKSLKTEGIIKYEGLLPDSIAELAMALDEDENVVRLAVEALINFGVIERWDNETIYMSAMQQLIGSESDSAARVRKHRALQGNERALLSNGDVTKSNTEIEKEIELEKDKDTEKKNAVARQSNDIEKEFEYLWTLYPRKQGKANALKAYTKARKGHPELYRDVEKGVKSYVAYLTAKKTDPQYIKQGSTWFNQRAWEDDYSVSGTAQRYCTTETDYSGGFDDYGE